MKIMYIPIWVMALVVVLVYYAVKKVRGLR